MKIIISESQFKNLLVETKECASFKSKLPACISKFRMDYDQNYKICNVPVKILNNTQNLPILVQGSFNDANVKFLDKNKYQFKDNTGKWVTATEPFSCNSLYWSSSGPRTDLGSFIEMFRPFGPNEVPLMSIEFSNQDREKSKSVKDFSGLIYPEKTRIPTIKGGPTPVPKELYSDFDPKSKFHEPNSSTTKELNGKYALKGQYVPKQTTSFYHSLGKWIKKTIENRSSWRDVPSGYHQLDWQKIGPHLTNAKANMKRSSATGKYKEDPLVKSYEAQYYNPDFPLGLTAEEKSKRQQDIQTAKAITKEKQSQLPRPSREIANKSDYFYDVARASEKQGEQMFSKEGKELLKSIDDYYGYFAKPESSGSSGGFLDWRNLLGFALHIIPLTAPYAYLYDIGLGLYKASQSLEKGEPGEAVAHVLFAFLPQTAVGKSLQKANALKVVDKVLKNKALSKADEAVLGMLSQNSSYLQTQLKNEIEKKLKTHLGKQLSEKQSKFLERAISKSYSQTQKAASFYEEIKNRYTNKKT